MSDPGPWETVERINRAWRSGDVDGVAHLFHPAAVIVHPRFEGRTEGRDACLRSYREFGEQATVHRLDELDRQVDVTGDTAVVSYRFEIEYDMEGQSLLDAGHDLFVLVRGQDGWQVVWRTLLLD